MTKPTQAQIKAALIALANEWKRGTENKPPSAISLTLWVCADDLIEFANKLNDEPQIDPNIIYPGKDKDPDFVFPEE